MHDLLLYICRDIDIFGFVGVGERGLGEEKRGEWGAQVVAAVKCLDHA